MFPSFSLWPFGRMTTLLCMLSDMDYAISQLPGNHRLPHLQDLNGYRIDRLIKSIEPNSQSYIGITLAKQEPYATSHYHTGSCCSDFND
ncbi:hypothetical protein F5051DRAFT_252735 [Lentinula edodes]|nr:hypothetical protein F5051DRAFT_252735 [Lentinula edodes]